MIRKSMALFLVATPLAQGAQAAEITYIPPFLRGDISLNYAYDRASGSLYEGEERVGSRVLENHLLTYSGVFTAAPGAALFFELPHYAGSRLDFPEANAMVYDPSKSAGTMVDTEVLEELAPIKGKGVDGVWLGLRGTPFSESFAKRGNRATWLLELAFQTRSSGNFYTVTDGERGAGVGGGGFRLNTAFSTSHGVSRPYLGFAYLRTRDIEVELYDEEGAVLVSAATLEPADKVTIRGGTELVAHDNPESDSRFSIDLRMAFGYRSWQTVPSGLYLPSVLSTSRDIPVTEGEYTWVSGGLGFYHQAFRYMQWHIVGDVQYYSPRQVEHTYDITTGSDTIGFTVGAGFRVMIRESASQ